MRHHVFISYARKDNEPRRGDGAGWVHLFRDQLIAAQRAATGRDLDVFLDEARIENGEDWETRIEAELRLSRIMVAVLSPHYLASPICRMELEHYIRHEQAAAPGGSGVRPIYFTTVPALEGEPAADHEEARLIADLQRRNRDQGLDWRSWREEGLAALLEIDAEERLAALAKNPAPPLDRFFGGVATLSDAIGRRLDDVALGDLARARGNLTASHRNFVGRSGEIAAIHRNLIHNQAQVVTALHGLGGQGKSALARQYAHAYASYYAAGGRWEVGCEGLGAGLGPEREPCALLALALDRLIAEIEPRFPEAALRLTPEEQARPALARAQIMLARLRAFTEEGWEGRLAALRGRVTERRGAWPAEHPPRMLVVFDNVDGPGLLNAEAQAALGAPDWLEMIVTTRLEPTEIGPGGGMEALAVDHLPEGDAAELIRGMIRGARNRPALDESERAAVRALARALGGFTLAVELAGAHLATYPAVSVAAYLTRLEAEGLSGVDEGAAEGSRPDQVRALVRHREGQVGLILDDMLRDLAPEALDALHLASHFGPDHVRLDWLRAAAGALHPALNEAPEGRESPWDAVASRLVGRRLLVPTEEPRTCRLHRMVRDHLRRRAAPERLARDREIAMKLTEAVGRAMEENHSGWQARPAYWHSQAPELLALVSALLDEGDADARLPRTLGLLASIEQKLGKFAVAEQLIVRKLRLAQGLYEAKPKCEVARRDVFVSLLKLGDLLAERGTREDSELAIKSYEDAVKIVEALVELNLQSAEAWRDLFVSKTRLGDILSHRGWPGDAERALEAYEAGLQITSNLVAAKPDCLEAQRDLSIARERLGNFLTARAAPGEMERALAALEASLTTNQALAAASPGSAEALRDLSVSQTRLGDALARRGEPGDAARALEAYKAALETDVALAVAYPSSAQAWQDVSVAHSRIGDFLTRRGSAGDAERAYQAYEAALATALALAEAKSGSAAVLRNLAVSHVKLGQFVGARGEMEAAARHFSEALRILEAFEAEGRMMDEEMRALLDALRQMFGGGA